jgi:hypothetical protein
VFTTVGTLVAGIVEQWDLPLALLPATTPQTSSKPPRRPIPPQNGKSSALGGARSTDGWWLPWPGGSGSWLDATLLVKPETVIHWQATSDVRQVPRFLIHDRDSIYGGDFRRRIRGIGTRLLATPPRAPTANAFAERMIGTLRRDCFDHIIIKDERHVERILLHYATYYHGRPDRGLRMQPPDGARHLPPPRPSKGTRILGIPILAGLHHRYGFVAPPRAPPSEEGRAA